MKLLNWIGNSLVDGMAFATLVGVSWSLGEIVIVMLRW